MPVAKKVTPPVEVAGINFGDLNMYAAGGGIPPGQYALEHTVQMFQAENKAGQKLGESRLGVMVKAHSLSDSSHQGDGAYTAFYSLGTNAHKSFAPNPDTGKSLVAIPGGSGSTLPDSTNWSLLLKSYYDSGLPAGVFSNDISVLDGTHVVIAHVPEPEERKSFGSATMENAGTERKNRTISVVSEILDDGKPWEGTGGIPTGATAVPVTKVNGAVKPTPISKPGTKATPASDEADVLSAAVNSGSEVLEKNPKGMAWLPFRTGTFSAVKKTYGDDMAQAVQDAYFTNDDGANSLLNQLGNEKAGAMGKRS